MSKYAITTIQCQPIALCLSPGQAHDTVTGARSVKKSDHLLGVGDKAMMCACIDTQGQNPGSPCLRCFCCQ